MLANSQKSTGLISASGAEQMVVLATEDHPSFG
jgi:hypothetical protein